MADAAATGEGTLKRTLGPLALVALGIGAIIGAGLFVRTAAAIADRAGPSVVLAFMVAGVGCAFAGLCYAEFASMIPVAGSAYTYSYATMGELVAWIIGWDLVLEYAVGAATVAIAWSEYANRVVAWFAPRIPFEWTHGPFESSGGIHGIMNLPAVFILFILTLLLIRGTKESAYVNAVIVVVKVSIVLLVIGIGWGFINPANHTPLIPAATTYTTPEGLTHDYGGIMGILGSLVVCTILYVLFSYVLSGVATVEDFRSTGREASVAFAISKYMTGYEWLSKAVTVAILMGFSSVILVMLLGQSRVFYSMSFDGLVPKIFSDVHPKYRTPYKSNMVFFVFTALFAAFLPEDIVGEMTSIGTLFAFILVCIGVWIMRNKRPDLPRGFTVPALPVVAVLGVIVCGSMIYGLGWRNWARLFVWLVIGLVFYFGYGRSHSRIERG
jgi:APA family basic amino acid/polyamine antiporter